MIRMFLMSITFFIASVDALYLAGHLHTKNSWAFLGRFCFLSDLGRLQFKFIYPYDECCHNILLYYDDGGQWASVYKNDSKNCFEKEAVIHPEDHQIINLTTRSAWSGCKTNNKTGKKMLQCSGGRSFRTLHERWWYIAISNCEAGAKGNAIDIEYEMKLTNGFSFWTEHFSADEFGILETNIVFLIIYSLTFTYAARVAVELANRQMLHTTYKMFTSCLGIELFGLLLLCIAMGTFATDGVGNEGLTIAGEILGAIAELGFLLMLLLLGKGFTITRGQLSHSGSIKLAVFITVYAVISVVLFLYEYVFSDPGLVLYVYESAAGYGLIGLRLTAWFWFTYGILFTVKHYPEKSGFYYSLYIFYSIWFFAVPIMVLVSTFAIPKYMRSKVVSILELCIDFLAYFIFLVLTRPSAANRNFPYHVRTSQIGIVKPDGKIESIVNFPHSVYGDPTDLNGNGNGHRAPNFAELFVVQPSGSLQNGSRSLGPEVRLSERPTTSTHHGRYGENLDKSRGGTSLQSHQGTSLTQAPPSYTQVTSQQFNLTLPSTTRIGTNMALVSQEGQKMASESNCEQKMVKQSGLDAASPSTSGLFSIAKNVNT
ncbi:transmembrane protein 145-like [Styela clava]